MSCKNKCPEFKKLIVSLEKAIADSGSSFVPESFEQKARDYCANCEYNGQKGTGIKKFSPVKSETKISYSIF